MLRNTKRTIIIIVAAVFLILGIIGLVLPFLQGILFIAIAAMLISILSPSFRQGLEKHTVKYPKVHEVVIKVERFVRRIVGEV